MALMLVQLKLDDYTTDNRSIVIFRVNHSLNYIASLQQQWYNIISYNYMYLLLVRKNMYTEKMS
jgi:hypothetical protein